jgi:hypothetical protein
VPAPGGGVAGLFGATEAAQQLASRGVQVAIALQGEAIDDVEPVLGPPLLGDRDRPAQLDDRRIGEAGKLSVEGGDLEPVILRFARTSRRAIVGSPTRKARAISPVVRPPSVRRVRATCVSTAGAG